MKDPIERQDAIDAFEDTTYTKNEIRRRITELPSAQQDCTECPEYDHERHSCPRYCDVIKQTLEEAKQERTGRWVRNFDGNEWYWFCSNCKEEWYEEDLLMGGNDFPNFCPNCGARMEGEG